MTWSHTDVPLGTRAAWPLRLSMPITNRLFTDPVAPRGTRSVVANRFQVEVRPRTSAEANVCEPSCASRLTVTGPAKSLLALAKNETR